MHSVRLRRVTDNLCRTPLYERQAALGARFVPFAGWEMPIQFAGVTQEHAATRTAAGLFDVSHMGELWVEGADAVAQVDRLITNDLKSLPTGKALYTLCCAEDGRILDDLIVYRVADDRVLTVCNASNRAKISAHYASQVGGESRFTDVSDDVALLALQGPRAAAIVAEALGEPALLDVPRFGIAEGRFSGAAVHLARTGYTGEDGFELFVDNPQAPDLWDHLLSVGASHGVQPVGLGARDTLRLEGSLRLYGSDMDETTGPYEAGLGWTIKLAKGDFIGRDALAAQKAAGPKRKLVGFEMVGRGIARHDYPIVTAEGTEVGRVTSGAPALSLKKNIGMGYVPAEMAKVGSTLGIAIRGKVVEAVVCKMPFYRRSE